METDVHLTALRPRSVVSVLVAALAVVCLSAPSPQAQSTSAVRAVAATEETPDQLRALVNDLRRMESSGSMRLMTSNADAMLDGHRHDRLQQFHLGLEVVGGTMVRQTALGSVSSILGQVYRTDLDRLNPLLSTEQITARLIERGLSSLADPVMKFLGTDDGGVRLVYETYVTDGGADPRTVYLDADSAVEVLSLPLIKHQAAVGEGTGVLGDRKKMSTRLIGGRYFAEDELRPPVLWTIDVASRNRFVAILNGAVLLQSDIADDTDNVWTDSAAVDAHTYLGWTYDYLFKRMEFRGLDNSDAPMFGTINLYSAQQCVSTVPAADFGSYCTNAFWANPPAGPQGRGMMFFGNGIPNNFVLTDGSGQTVGPLAGALDVVSHELTHGVTAYTSRLEYRSESGALNESISDIVGVAVEAYYQPRGSALMQADYLIGEDAYRARLAGSVSGIRSLQAPTAYGDRDHYSQRYTGTVDNGGVHTNSGISNHAYFLAIEGGTNRVSGRAVTGVGFANREQIERVFFRAFMRMLPVRATFSQARSATIQSARDLYGSVPNVERAVSDAWSAVGVQ